MLEFKDICFSVPDNNSKKNQIANILKGISGSVNAGEMLAVMGPSGSGKTTLLHILGARNQGKGKNETLSGTVSVNGEALRKEDRKKIGFVLQEDILYPQLSARETLTYSARLRLPSSIDKKRRVDEIIDLLGLNRIADSPICKLSGGEKKRVAIGVELLINPSILFMDEPTSGLDSHISFEIMSKVKQLAKESNAAIISTIHQPSSHLFKQFDKVLLLVQGNVVFFGEASRVISYFEGIGYPCPVHYNPADHLIDLVSGPKEQIETLIETWKKERIGEGANSPCADEFSVLIEKSNSIGEKKSRASNKWEAPFWEQVKTLASRALKTSKGQMLDKIYLIETVIISVVVSILWFQMSTSTEKSSSDASSASLISNRHGLLFFSTVYWGFHPLFGIVCNFPLDKDIFFKERASRSYCLSAYLIGRSFVDVLILAVQPSFYWVLVYWCTGLNPEAWRFFASWLVLLLSCLTAQSFGYLFGCLMMDVRKSIATASIFMLSSMLVSGLYIKSLPAWISWIDVFSFSRYALSCLLQLEFGFSSRMSFSYGADGVSKTGAMVLQELKVDTNSFALNIGILLIFTVVTRILAYLSLKYLQKHQGTR